MNECTCKPKENKDTMYAATVISMMYSLLLERYTPDQIVGFLTTDKIRKGLEIMAQPTARVEV